MPVGIRIMDKKVINCMETVHFTRYRGIYPCRITILFGCIINQKLGKLTSQSPNNTVPTYTVHYNNCKNSIPEVLMELFSFVNLNLGSKGFSSSEGVFHLRLGVP